MVKGIQPLLRRAKENTFSLRVRYYYLFVGGKQMVLRLKMLSYGLEEQGKFNMVFQFEHLSLWDAEKKKDLDVVGLKKY